MRRLGRISFVLVLPLLRLYLRRTNRAYGLVVSEKEVVLVKGWLARQTWQLPGGGVHRGESPEQAVVREVGEEVGLDIANKQAVLLTSGRWQTDKLGQNYSIYLVKASKKPLKVSRPELIEAKWVNVGELNPSNCPPEVLQALEAAHLL